MKRVIIVHGWGGKPGNHFKPWLRRELEARDIQVFEPEMPNSNNPVLLEWLDTLSKVVKSPDLDTVILGHSLGCVTIARYVAGLKDNENIGGAIFVAGFYTDIGYKEIEEFYSTKGVIEKAKSHAKKFVSIASDNDPDVPVLKAKELNDALDGEFILEKGKGHFCEEDGVTELPSALDTILSIFNL